MYYLRYDVGDAGCGVKAFQAEESAEYFAEHGSLVWLHTFECVSFEHGEADDGGSFG